MFERRWMDKILKIKGMITINTLSTKINAEIHGIIGLRRLCEQVCIIKELGASHHGTVLAKAAYCVLEEYSLTQKVDNFFLPFLIINIISTSMNFFILLTRFRHHK